MFAPVQCASQPQKRDPETRTALVVWCYCWTRDHSVFMLKTLLIVAGLAYLMPCGAQENPTLAAVLTEHSIALPPEPAPHLNARIASYGILDDEKEFVIGYYLDRPNFELKAPLLLTRFDKTTGRWDNRIRPVAIADIGHQRWPRGTLSGLSAARATKCRVVLPDTSLESISWLLRGSEVRPFGLRCTDGRSMEHV